MQCYRREVKSTLLLARGSRPNKINKCIRILENSDSKECKTNLGYIKSKNAKQSVVTIEQSGLNMQAVPLIGKIF